MASPTYSLQSVYQLLKLLAFLHELLLLGLLLIYHARGCLADKRLVRQLSVDSFKIAQNLLLLSRESVIGLIRRLVPRRLTLALRSGFDRWGASRAAPAPRDSGQRELAERALGDQRERVRELFSEQPILLGDGTVP